MRGRNFRKGMEFAGVVFVAIVLWFCAIPFIRGGKDSALLEYLKRVSEQMGYSAIAMQSPSLCIHISEGEDSLLEALETRLLKLYPLYTWCMDREIYTSGVESKITYEMILANEGRDEEAEEQTEPPTETENDNSVSPISDGNLVADEEAMYPLSSIKNYQTALDLFYHVDSTTMLGEDLLKVEEFLKKDMTVHIASAEPTILIYHTHSQEGYAGSDKTVVDVGNVLTDLLEKKYGISVLHHTGEYDVENRDNAYSKALPEITEILKNHPSIQVVIDLHRDGVNENTHLVTTIDGKPVAQIMFFNGVSQTKKNGAISYLNNPNLMDNLAFSFQMQLAAKTYYPGLTRDIYIKGYRYNMHLCPKSLLVEVGAQTNTYQEAVNAMDYLAELLYRVLTVKR